MALSSQYNVKDYLETVGAYSVHFVYEEDNSTLELTYGVNAFVVPSGDITELTVNARHKNRYVVTMYQKGHTDIGSLLTGIYTKIDAIFDEPGRPADVPDDDE